MSNADPLPTSRIYSQCWIDNQGSKIALVHSYLRVPRAAGQVKILIFLVKFIFFPYANNFCDSAGIYVFHTWSFCAGRKTSTVGLFEHFIIIICWIFCAYTQILSRDVEDFCVHDQKFLIMISDNKVFQH